MTQLLWGVAFFVLFLPINAENVHTVCDLLCSANSPLPCNALCMKEAIVRLICLTKPALLKQTCV